MKNSKTTQRKNSAIVVRDHYKKEGSDLRTILEDDIYIRSLSGLN